MTAPVLRPYQEQGQAAIRAAFLGCRRVLFQSATGSGKTVLFADLVHRVAAKQKRVVILLHRLELLEQVCDSLDRVGQRYGIIAAGYTSDLTEPVQVASVFTLVRRLGRVRPPDLIVADEAHHAIATTTWGKILAHFPHSYVLGVTATPVRLSGEGLSECFDRLIVGPTVTDLIDQGYLVPCRVYAPPLIRTDSLHVRMGEYVTKELEAVADTPSVTGDAVEHYLRLAPGKQAVAFCVSVEHAKHIAAAFEGAGVRAHSVDGNLDRGLRRSIVRAFAEKRIQVLTSCDLISEGYDCPGIEVGISLRPTQSEGLWLQQCGRILRPAPGKTEALILDHAGNTMRHGFPDDEREWSLEGSKLRAERKMAENSRGVRVCPTCFAACRAGAEKCPYCGTAFPLQPREVEHKDGQLAELTKQQAEQAKQILTWRRKREQWSAKTYEDLLDLARRRGYSAPERWAGLIIDARRKIARKRAWA